MIALTRQSLIVGRALFPSGVDFLGMLTGIFFQEVIDIAKGTHFADLFIVAEGDAKALVEFSGVGEHAVSDPFCGTRFFQSLNESGIVSIITNADKTDDVDTSFLTDSLDLTEDWVGVPAKFKNCVRILSTRNWYGSRSLTIESNQDQGIVKAFFI